jgi:bifunctional non-homologous end joining protein LigD
MLRCACTNNRVKTCFFVEAIQVTESVSLQSESIWFTNLPETGRARWGEILDAEKMKQCVWVRPKLVAVIEFLEWTEADRLRHSKFVALHEGKDPRDVIKEV